MRDASALRLFPAIQLLDYEAAVRLALEKMSARGVETAWSDALTSSQGNKTPVALISSEGMILERRQRRVAAPTESVYRSFAGLGGARGWLYMDWAGQLRGQWTGYLAVWECAGAGVIRRTRAQEIRWTFGAWKWWSREG